MKKLLLLFNPRAGREEFRMNLFEVVELFTKAGFEVTARPTVAAGEASEIAGRAGEFDCVVCSGGDGTLNETVSGMMGVNNRPPLGYIPSGSTNDFAGSLGLPRDILQAAYTVTAGTPRKLDVGRFNGRWFTYVAAFGMFTDIPYDTPQERKNLLGHTAYLLESVKRLGSIESFHCKISAGQESFRGNFIFGMVTNASQVAGFRMPDEMEAMLDDGVFEMILLKRPRSFADLQNIVASLVSGQLLSSSFIVRKISSLRFLSAQPVGWTLDGEFGGKITEAEIECRPRALEIIAPPINS